MINTLKSIGKFILPYYFVHLYRLKREQRRERTRKERMQRAAQSIQPLPATVNYDGIIEYYIREGIARDQLIAGSMPERSLHEAANVIAQHFGSRAVIGLHIGNFVGVSLVFLAKRLMDLNPESHHLAIDPNIPHRGVKNPQEMVINALAQFGLTKSVSILTGYSLEKNISNDGKDYTAQYDPLQMYSAEHSCENQLAFLRKMDFNRFDFAVLDGNHDKQYLLREISMLQSLLSDGGLIILDDVNANWEEIQEVFEESARSGWEKLFSDDRIGILANRKI